MRLEDGKHYVLELKSIFNPNITYQSIYKYDEMRDAFFSDSGGKVTTTSERFVAVLFKTSL